jgi:hypothetical protein
VLRAMEVSERAGVPAVGIFGPAFLPLAQLLAERSGVPAERLAVYPGMMATDSEARLAETARNEVTPQIVDALLTAASAPVAPVAGPAGDLDAHRTIVFRGTLDQVQDHFGDQGWSDGLPVIPPTPDRVASFLRLGGRGPNEVLGLLAPEHREATVASVAANGVMAGCRPEYMPILLAIVECLADPVFRIEDAGSTPGWEPLVIVSGPLVQALNFNAGTGAMRVGRQANSSIGRFVRLYMRNVAGLRIPPGVTDQAGFGYTFNVAMAEDDDAVRGLGWAPFRVDRGFALEDTVVTVQGVVNIGSPIYTHGDDPMEHLHVISHYLARAIAPNVAVPSLKRGQGFHLLAMSPSIARVFADHGMGKDDIAGFLFEQTRTGAGFLEYVGRQATVFNLHDLVEAGVLSSDYALTHDPDRQVRVLLTKGSLGIVVTGNPGRNQSRCYVGNHAQGIPVSRPVTVAE